MRYVSFVIVSLFLCSTFFTSSFGQASSPASTGPLLSVTTDKPSYLIGDNIVISGEVKSVVEGTPLTVQVLDPNNNLVQVAQIDVSEDGKFTKAINSQGTLWKATGTYTIKVQYGLPNVTAQTTFLFQSSTIPTSNTFQLKDPSSQQTFNVNYTINGGTISDITIDAQSFSLIVTVNSTSDGTVTLQLPRNLIDAKTNSGQDDSFIILIDGAEVKTESESANNEYRTIAIKFLQGDKDIEIIGTQIVPEFGPIAALVLVIAIVSIIAISKTGPRLMPKY